jgi:hypothetical protein
MLHPGKACASPILRSAKRATWYLAVLVAAGLSLHETGSAVRAEPPPLPPAEQAKVNDAVLRGVIYLRSMQGIDGSWAATDKPHRLGYAALPGLTLMECGLPSSHSVIQKAEAFISQAAAKEGATYDIALAILFLDRLSGTQSDLLQALTEKKRIDKIIEVLAYRLIAGQTVTGGWGYNCQVLDQQQHEQLKRALELRKVIRARLAPWMKNLAVFQDPDKLMVAKDPAKEKRPKKKGGEKKEPEGSQQDTGTDNSNTHFALLGLWVAQRHDVPVERTFKLVGKRFRSSQNPDGGWGYKYQLGGTAPNSQIGTSPAMTCTGLVGLAVERGLTPPEEVAGMPLATKAATKLTALVGSNSLLNHYIAARTLDRALARDEEAKKRRDDPTIAKALQALSNFVGQPTGKTENIPIGDLYFMWALERVSMIYDLKTLGDKEWYRWGAEMLVANVKPEGYWNVKGVTDELINSCFALLFLRQANIAEDLTTKLRNDPSLLDRPLAKKETPAENKVATQPTAPSATPPAATPPAATPPPPAAKSSPSTSPQVAMATPKSTATQSQRASPPPPPATATPTATESSPPKESNHLLIWLAGLAGVVLIGVAATLVVLGMRQRGSRDDEDEDEEDADRQPRRRPGRERRDGTRADGPRRRPAGPKRPTRSELE